MSEIRTFGTVTLGCRANYADTQGMRAHLIQAGMVPVSEASDRPPAIFLVNTCTVTNQADADSRAWVRRLRRRNPEGLIVVTGCYAQLHGAVLLQAGADFVIGNAEKERVAELLGNGIVERRTSLVERKTSARSRSNTFVATEAAEQDRIRPVLKIQEGCDQCCSFCIIPKTRGRSKSLPPKTVLERYRSLGDNGAKEVVLSGIQLSAYGHDLNPKTTLHELIAALDRESQASWIRISSMEPSGLTDEFISTVSESGKVCPHFHIPMQSGDDSILKAMRRPYTIDWYSDRIRSLARTLSCDHPWPRSTEVRTARLTLAARHVPNAQIGTDVMVGFPGETDEQFENTMERVEALPLAYLHVFPYSIRPGTKAAGLVDTVDHRTKRRRVREMVELGDRKRRAFLERHVGSIHHAIVETVADGDGVFKATARNYIKMRFRARGDLRGRVVRLRAERVAGAGMEASLLETS